MNERARRRATAEKRLVYNMRPEGCQKPVGRLSKPANHRFHTSFQPILDRYEAMHAGRRVGARRRSSWPARPRSCRRRSSARSTSRCSTSGAPVPNLGPTDFIVREDNVAREVLRVAPATDPMQIAMLVDNSTAAARSRAGYPPGAAGVSSTMLTAPTASGRRNEVAIITLASRPTILADYSIERGAARQGDRTRSGRTRSPAGSTCSTASSRSSQGFKKRESDAPGHRRHHTEGPELSNRHPDQVLDPLRDSGAALHVITLGLPAADIERRCRRYRDMVVDQGRAETGGTHAQLLTSARRCQAG